MMVQSQKNHHHFTMKFSLIKSLLLLVAMELSTSAQTNPAPSTPPAPPAPPPPATTATLETWNAALPFSFNYEGKPSSQFISSWQRGDDLKPAEGGEIHHISFVDPATRLKITSEVRTFTDFSALDWMLTFTNEGTADTPILDSIEPLDWVFASTSNSPYFMRWAGGNGNWEDFNGGEMDPNGPKSFSSAEGLSSRVSLPYFLFGDANYNGVEAVKGPGGFSVAIGWTGNWNVTRTYNNDAKTLRVVAGMQKTHLLLHPGESIRTPRIVILNWKSSVVDAQNLWRTFVLKYYSQRDVLKLSSGGHLPVALVTGGNEPMDARLARIKQIQDAKIPIDLYWVDSGWYGTGDAAAPKLRGSWTPNPALFPNGVKPLVDALHGAGMDPMFWLEPETADPASTLLTAHPDWFFPAAAGQPSLLNFGNPAARQGITDLVSNLITDTCISWLHQDFNPIPEPIWAAADAPDRVGISEINYITGLYAFWDELHAKHPNLILDDSARGGMRLDIEAVRRSIALSRTMTGDPKAEQLHTQELSPWVPLNAGTFAQQPQEPAPGSAAQLYVARSSYGPAWVINDGKLALDDTLCQIAEEYRRVQPFFLGDFYPLSPYAREDNTGVAWQWHRPDLKAGVVLVFRRDKCPFSAVQPFLQVLDPKASYDVEVRHGLTSDPIQHMTGSDLARIQIPIPDQPGSAILFYQQK
jgi:alpha-galactosidase